MTRFQALYVKYLRVRLGCSWRVISAMYTNRYHFKVPFNLKLQENTSQQYGRLICYEAEELLKERFDEEDVIF